VTENSDYRSPINRAVAYSVSPPEYTEGVQYTVPNTYGIQIKSVTTLGEKPVQCTCTKCHTLILTRVHQTPGLLPWILFIILILLGCWLGCCLIPFCISDIQNTQHYCPNCKTLLGEYRPI
jgi:lipopolysaccharide-induced tumor necrosis factor-alpha factor